MIERELGKILEGWTVGDYKEWLDHPFWEATMMIVQEQITFNERDILQGDMEQRAAHDPMCLYKNDDMLRGGRIALKAFSGIIPDMVEEAILEANAEETDGR